MFNAKLVIGLDVGTANIKLAVFKKETATEHELIIETIPLDYQHDEEKRVAYTLETLKKIISQKPYLKNSVLISAIPRRISILKYVNLPSADKNEIANMIPFEIQRHIPLPLDSVVMDYQTTIESESQGKQIISKVLVVVVKKDIIEKHLNLLSAVGFTPERMGLSSLATYNFFVQEFPQELGHVLLLDIGAQNMEINIMHNGLLRFTYCAAIGGDTLNHLLEKGLNREFAELENLKRDSAFLSDTKTEAIVSEWIKLLAAEISRSLSFGNQSSSMITKIYLTGGGSKLANLAELLEKRLKIPVSDLNRDENFFAIAKGLAYQGLDKEKISINLLPINLRQNRAGKKQRKIITVVAGVLGVIAFALMIFCYAEINKKQRQLNQVEQELRSLKKEIEETRGLQTKIQLLQGKNGQNEIFLEALRQISLIAPANIAIDHLVCEREGRVTLRGKTDSHSAAATFSILLEKSRYFEKVVNKGSHEEKAGTLNLVEFEIECWLKGI